MKKIFPILLCFITSTLFAQTDYYNGTDGLYGSQLKAKLHSIVKGHTRYPYTSSGTDVWDMLKETDKDTTNPANVIFIHSGWKQNAAMEYANGSGWTREHVWAKSHGFPNEGDTAYTDAHHLRPCDVSVNSSRGNKDFDNGGDPKIDASGFIQNGGVTGCFTDDDSWEPRDAVKGDIARMMFYMVVRYESSATYDLELVDYTGTSGPLFGKLSTLLEWHRNDPVDDYERNRNNVIYSFQGNRNPFIDHPEFVDRLYNDNGLVIEKCYHISDNQIVVTFNKEVQQSSAELAVNYAINKGIGTPVSAVKGYNGDNKSVLLTLGNSLTTTTEYIVTVNNLQSTVGDNILADSPTSLSTPAELPVELSLFEVFESKGKATLLWETTTELNNYGFQILKKVGKDDWSNVGFVEGAGNSNSTKKYSFTDNETVSGEISYRLKQIDFDGKYEYSVIRVFSNGNNPDEYLLKQNYPNPFNPSTTISYSLPQNGNVEIKLYDVLGNEIATVLNSVKEAGNYDVKFDASSLASGMYIYTIRVNDYTATKKMLLVK